MKNLASIFEKLQSNQISVTGFQISNDFDMEDHNIDLTNGFYIQIGENYYSIGRDNGDDTFSDFGTFRNFNLLVENLKKLF
jgi:hypothetical protein